MRSGLPTAFPLPADRDHALVLHDIVLRAESSYAPAATVVTAADLSSAHQLDLALVLRDGVVSARAVPVSAAFPGQFGYRRARLALAPGQRGVLRLNFRFTGCSCQPWWWYEEWIVHVAHVPDGARVPAEVLMAGEPDTVLDQRMSLYGCARKRWKPSART